MWTVFTLCVIVQISTTGGASSIVAASLIWLSGSPLLLPLSSAVPRPNIEWIFGISGTPGPMGGRRTTEFLTAPPPMVRKRGLSSQLGQELLEHEVRLGVSVDRLQELEQELESVENGVELVPADALALVSRRDHQPLQ